jgi:Tfp pilus assembly protein PilO
MKPEEGNLVAILQFLIFIVLVVISIVALGYCLFLYEERTVSRRCVMPHRQYRRKKV